MISSPEKNPALIDFLKTRRSNLAKVMQDPGPSPEELETILTIGARVPDHRKLAPWRYITIQSDARIRLGEILRDEFRDEHPELPDDRAAFEAGRLLRAPLIIAVVSSPVDCPRGTPKWEQQLSAGAVCLNLCLAAQAHGFGAQWLTEWYAYNAKFCNNLGLKPEESIAGFVYIGSVRELPVERARPELKEILTILS